MAVIVMLFVFILSIYFGPGVHIGEAANPGPALDDPDVDPFEELNEYLDEPDEWVDVWGEAPPDEAANLSEGPRFTAARRFGGAKAGMVFKRGDSGLGYYADVPPVLELAPLLWPLSDVPPVVIRLETLLAGGSSRMDESCGAARKRQCRRARRSGRRRARCGPESCRGTL